MENLKPDVYHEWIVFTSAQDFSFGIFHNVKVKT